MDRTVAFGRTLAVSTINGIRFTAREGEFLRHVKAGLNLHEIARAMGIGVDSAKTYQNTLRRAAGLTGSIGRRPNNMISGLDELRNWIEPKRSRKSAKASKAPGKLCAKCACCAKCGRPVGR